MLSTRFAVMREVVGWISGFPTLGKIWICLGSDWRKFERCKKCLCTMKAGSIKLLVLVYPLLCAFWTIHLLSVGFDHSCCIWWMLLFDFYFYFCWDCIIWFDLGREIFLHQILLLFCWLRGINIHNHICWCCHDRSSSHAPRKQGFSTSVWFYGSDSIFLFCNVFKIVKSMICDDKHFISHII